MFIDWDKARLFMRPGETDMRKQINGLAAIVQGGMAGNLFEGSLYLFCSKNKRRLKILYWDRNGFCLWVKRLEKDRFPWPGRMEEAREINTGDLRMILDGIDFFNAHQSLNFSTVL
jgi:transposase